MCRWNNNFKKQKERNKRRVKHLISSLHHILREKMKKLKDCLNTFSIDYW